MESRHSKCVTSRPSVHDRADAGRRKQSGVSMGGWLDGRHGGSWKVRTVRTHHYYSQGWSRDLDIVCLLQTINWGEEAWR